MWIVLAIAAAGFQTLRFALQKSLNMGGLSAGGATMARFAYAAPFVVLLTVALLWGQGAGVPRLGQGFWPYVLVGGLAQILATWAVVVLFRLRNFAVGIAFKKTEVMQTALVGLLVLGDRVSLAGTVAIALGLAGVVVLSGTARGVSGRAVVLGLLSGAFFAVSAVAYRGATLAVGVDAPLVQALMALSAVTMTQSLGMGLWLGLREPGTLARLWSVRAQAVWLGLAGMGGSICWFTAFAMMNAAYVFAVGQVEVIFSILVSVFFFGETVSRREYWGIGLVTASILGLVAVG